MSRAWKTAFVIATVPSLLLANACAETEDVAAPSVTVNVRGKVSRDGAPVAFARVVRVAPPFADGGTSNATSFTDGFGGFFVAGFSAPYALSIFDVAQGGATRALYEVQGLGTTVAPNASKDVELALRFGSGETRRAWRARVRLHMDDDVEVKRDDAARTIVLAGGSAIAAVNVAPENPTALADVDVAWEGSFESFVRLHVLRFVPGETPRYLAAGSLDLGNVRDGQTLERQMDLHPVTDTQRVPYEVRGAENATARVSVALGFGDAVRAPLFDVSPGQPLVVPKLGGARLWLTARAERDGDQSITALPPEWLPIPDARTEPLTMTLESFITVSEPAADTSVAARDARFSFALPASAKTTWVHELELRAVDDAARGDRVDVTVITAATSTMFPTGEALGVPVLDADAGRYEPRALAAPRGTYEWRIVSRPDLPNVDVWAAAARDVRFERVVRTRPRRVTITGP